MKIAAAAWCLLVTAGCTSVVSSPRPLPRATEVPAPTGEIEVRRAQGLDVLQVRALLKPSLPSLHQCAPGSGGKINVAITRTEGALHVAVEPGPSLDPVLRECVLQALSSIDVEQSGGDVPGVGVRPSGFTSLVAISW
jgi:hypothetical protein